MSTAVIYSPVNTENDKGLAIQVDQLIDSNNNAVNVSDITALLSSAGNFLKVTRATVAATGSTVTDAAPLTATFNSITATNGTKGVLLPTAPVAGTVVIVKNTVASQVLKVWPDPAATVNAIGSNGAISLASGAIPAIFIADSTTQWYTIPLLPS